MSKDTCPKCGNASKEKMVKLSTMDTLICRFCDTEFPWIKGDKQLPLVPTSRQTRKPYAKD